MGKNSKKVKTTVGCMFAGIGGFCRTFLEADDSILWATNKDRFAPKTFELSFPAVRHILKPVEELSIAIAR